MQIHIRLKNFVKNYLRRVFCIWKKTLLKSKKQWSCSKLTLNFMIKLQLLSIFLYFFCVIFQFFPPGSRSAYWMRNWIHSLPGLKFVTSDHLHAITELFNFQAHVQAGQWPGDQRVSVGPGHQPGGGGGDVQAGQAQEWSRHLWQVTDNLKLIINQENLKYYWLLRFHSLSGFSYSIIHPPNIHHSSTYHPMIPITHPQSYPSFIYRAIHYSPTARAIHNSLTEQYGMSLGLSYPSFIIWVLNDIAVHLSMINRSLSHRTTHQLATDLILHLPT